MLRMIIYSGWEPPLQIDQAVVVDVVVVAAVASEVVETGGSSKQRL